jgi:hypothetical protein
MLLVSCAFVRRLKFRVGCKSWTETSSLERWSPGQSLPYRMRLTGQFEVVIITRGLLREKVRSGAPFFIPAIYSLPSSSSMVRTKLISSWLTR